MARVETVKRKGPHLEKSKLIQIPIAILAVLSVSAFALNLGLFGTQTPDVTPPKRTRPTPRPALFLPAKDSCLTLEGNPQLRIEAEKFPSNANLKKYCKRFSVTPEP